jgi:hypothetical protein
MRRWTIEQWIAQVQTVASDAAPMLSHDQVHLGAGALDVPFALAVGAVPPAHGHVYVPPDNLERQPGEIALWWAISDESIGIEPFVDLDGDGPLLDRDAYAAIEVWTDAELSALHALWTLGHMHHRGDWLDRIQRACAWHEEHTQPDNATNRPWALHVFVLRDIAESQHYAQTLLQNAQIGGTPEPLSAWILLDAAHHLKRVQKTRHDARA